MHVTLRSTAHSYSMMRRLVHDPNSSRHDRMNHAILGNEDDSMPSTLLSFLPMSLVAFPISVPFKPPTSVSLNTSPLVVPSGPGRFNHAMGMVGKSFMEGILTGASVVGNHAMGMVGNGTIDRVGRMMGGDGMKIVVTGTGTGGIVPTGGVVVVVVMGIPVAIGAETVTGTGTGTGRATVVGIGIGIGARIGGAVVGVMMGATTGLAVVGAATGLVGAATGLVGAATGLRIGAFVGIGTGGGGGGGFGTGSESTTGTVNFL
jgi:hypothetical protein